MNRTEAESARKRGYQTLSERVKIVSKKWNVPYQKIANELGAIYVDGEIGGIESAIRVLEELNKQNWETLLERQHFFKEKKE